MAVIFHGLVDKYTREESAKMRRDNQLHTSNNIFIFRKESSPQGAGRIVGNFVADRQIHANTTNGKESARTIDNPVSFSLHVLTEGNELQVFHALRVTGRRGRRSGFMFLVFVMNNAPSAVDNSFDFSTVTKL